MPKNQQDKVINSILKLVKLN